MPSFRAGAVVISLLLGMRASAQDFTELTGGFVGSAAQRKVHRQKQDVFGQPERLVLSQPSPSERLPLRVVMPESTTDAGPRVSAPTYRYSVDGRGLDDALDLKTLTKDYSCTPSTQFAGSTWCRSRSLVRQAPVATSMLVSSAGKLVYHSKVYETASFAPADVVDEIERLSRKHRARPRIMRAPSIGDDEGVIAVWGDVTLLPVDDATRGLLANGSSVEVGILIDFLNNVRDSARRGFPVFRLGGGPGSFWAAKVDAEGRGSLRFGTSDVAAFDGPPAAGTSAPPSPGNLPASRLGPSDVSQERLDSEIAEARHVLDEAIAFEKTEKADPEVLELIQAISDLNAALVARDLDTIKRKKSTLTITLDRYPRFVAFRSQRLEASKRQTAQDVADAVRRARGYRSFLIATVTADPTSSTAATFLPLIRRLDSAVASPDLQRLGSLNSAVDLAVRQAGLGDRYDASLAMDAPSGAAQAANVTSSEPAVPTGNPPAIEGRPAKMPQEHATPDRGEREKVLRAASQENARKSTAKINDEIKQYVHQPSDQAIVAQEFPEFSEWFEAEASEGWSSTDESFEIADYGEVDWQGRKLPVPMTRATFHFSNAALNKAQEYCFLFGRIDDAEGNAAHDPISVECGDVPALERWRNSHSFTSRWIIN